MVRKGHLTLLSVRLRRLQRARKAFSYDISGAQVKIIAAGLPEVLANRLQFGR